jgi:hypothetical protein
MKSRYFLLPLVALLAFGGFSVFAAPEDLARDFRQPPLQTRPWCFWYWMNDHISREGVTHDLEAMKQIGIGTALIGNIYLAGMRAGPVPVLSDEWWNLMAFAVKEGRRVGIDIGIFDCAGWSQSGGPWISSSQTMRFVNWSETRTKGGQVFSGYLPVPRLPFQDVAVLAVPVPAEDAAVLSAVQPKVESSALSTPAGAQPLGSLIDGDRTTGVRFPPGEKEWTVTLTAPQPFTARSLTLAPSPSDFKAQVKLERESQPGAYETVRSFTFDRSVNRREVGFVPYAPLTISFPDVTATRWRLQFTSIETKDPEAGIEEIELSASPRVERVMEKQLAKLHQTSQPLWGAYLWPADPEPDSPDLVTMPGRVIDLTKQMDADGHLTWTAPPGNWVILRLGMNPTGVDNHPAGPQATGPEVDRMSPEALRHHYHSFVDPLLRRLTADDRKALKYLAIDSYETGGENWTDGFAEQFERRYHYDPKPWLPVLTGRIVGSADRSNRFLWDLRRLVADRTAYDYVGVLRDLAHADGMEFWLENYGHWGFPAEFLQYGGQSDRVGGEFWLGKALGEIENRAAASAVHTYGKPIAYSEAFTSSEFFKYYPYLMKARGDWAFAEGINQFVLNSFMQEPDDVHLPGVNAFFGTEFNRHITWFGPGKAWVDYLRRCHLLLQQGRNVADVAYFIGEDAPKMTGIRDPELPAGYNYDYINAEVILQRLTVKDGRFQLPDGTNYGVLVLPKLKTMRPAVLAKLHDLVRAGGTIMGPPPSQSPSLENYPACDENVRRLAATLWSNDVATGSGRVVRGDDLAGTLRQLGLAPDVSAVEPKRILWTHRTAPDREIYFLSNQTDDALAISPVFRVRGRAPELWNSVSGEVERTARFAAVPEGTRVDIPLGPRGSIFVVFPNDRGAAVNERIVGVSRDGLPDPVITVTHEGGAMVAHVTQNGRYRFERGAGGGAILEAHELPKPIDVQGPWKVQFPPHRDVPEQVEMPELASWTMSSNVAIRYFSGTATYESSVTVPPEAFAAGRHFQLDLGNIGMIAEVSVNGHEIGTTWLPPYRLDVTSELRPGANQLTIAVTNLWRNRIAGELEYPNGYPSGPRPKQFQTELLDVSRLKREQPLDPSGLLGPVRIVTEQDMEIGAP